MRLQDGNYLRHSPQKCKSIEMVGILHSKEQVQDKKLSHCIKSVDDFHQEVTECEVVAV